MVWHTSSMAGQMALFFIMEFFLADNLTQVP